MTPSCTTPEPIPQVNRPNPIWYTAGGTSIMASTGGRDTCKPSTFSCCIKFPDGLIRVRARAAQLGGERGERRFVVVVKASRLALTHKQYALDPRPMYHGHTQKALVRSGIGQQQEVPIEFRRQPLQVELATALRDRHHTDAGRPYSPHVPPRDACVHAVIAYPRTSPSRSMPADPGPHRTLSVAETVLHIDTTSAWDETNESF